jgi:hypothetical protein
VSGITSQVVLFHLTSAAEAAGRTRERLVPGKLGAECDRPVVAQKRPYSEVTESSHSMARSTAIPPLQSIDSAQSPHSPSPCIARAKASRSEAGATVTLAYCTVHRLIPSGSRRCRVNIPF